MMLAFLALLGLTADAAEKRTLNVDGVERSFWVQVPDNVKKSGKRSAVVVFHGAGPDRSDDKGAKFAKHTRMAKAAAAYGAITVFPNGVQGAWYPPQWAPDGVDDIAFARRLSKLLIQEYGVRPGRIGAAGFSSGGHMAMQWACNDRRVGGLVVVGAGLSNLQAKSCEVSAPLPTMFVLGTRDPVNPYDGGAVNGARSKEGRAGDVKVRSATGSGAYFAKQNGCKDRPPRRIDVITPRGRNIGVRDRHKGCRKGRVEVVSLPVGHVWPLGGTKQAHLGASAEIAKFLRRRVWSKKLRD